MKTSIEALEVVIENSEGDWRQILDNFLKDDFEEFSEEIKVAIEEFFDAYKEDIISNNTHELNLIEKKIDNSLLYNNIHNYVRGQLRTYYLVAPLRSLAVQDANKASKAINDMFEQSVLRFNPQIIEKYEDYGFSNEDAMADVLNVFVSFCLFVAEENFYYTAIEDMVYKNFRLPKKICKLIAEIIDNNFQQIKINYIIERLKKIEL